MNTFPELPLDPPDDEMPECPQCDVPLTTARPGLAECGSCGWINEPDWSMEDDQ
jgi:hypothetical protein